MIARIAYRVLTLSTLATFLASLWVLTQSPFTQPLVARSDAAAKAALARAMTWRVTPEWAETELSAALDAEDYDKMVLVLQLAQERDIPVPRALLEDMAVFAAREEAPIAQLSDCAACAYDIAACQRLSQIAACALPVELTPLGDLNALRRAGSDYVSGNEVDRLDAGLALVGLGATALVLVSGGSSATVKAGASLVRVARRMGALTTPFQYVLREAADLPIAWRAVPEYVLGRVELDEVTDAAKLAALGEIAHDLGAIRTATSTTDALVLMRVIDTADDAKRMARLAQIEGKSSRATVQVLGKSRAFRAMVRLSKLALLAWGLIAALALQLLALIAETLRIALRPRRRIA